MKVVQVVRSSAGYTFEEVALKAKSVYRLTHDYGIETCVICNAKGKPDWQVALFDDSWGFLCGSCGYKLAESIGKSN